MPSWLPPLVLFKDYGSDWTRYIEAVYEFFKKDFVDSQPFLEKMPVYLLIKEPKEQNKEPTFWHMTSQNLKNTGSEDDRTPAFERCERIRWPRPIIDNRKDPLVKVWENERSKGRRNLLLWFNDEYLVILVKKRTFLLLMTAYPIEEGHQRRKLEREFQEYCRTRNP
ncbi:MAG TPA: hypothetical protein PLV42_04700 [bacterium]|nr:hypothetical protein [bacterium]